ncbi:MAG: Trk family potassium uptake protein, partial [Armatimonadetes bacterium]|nr:Trk family potassium uptake protein [Armatimonadota bacterium]
VLDTPKDWSLFGQIVILILLQIGGLGTMTMASVLRMLAQGRSSVVQRLAVQDTVAPGAADVVGVVRRIVLFTLLCEGLGAMLLTWRWASQGVATGRAVWLGLFHSVSAFCNAGFSLFSNSLENYAGDAVVTGVVGLLIILGGLGFPVMLELAHWARSQLRARRVRLSLHSQVVLLSTLLLLLLGFALFLLVEWDGAFGSLAPQEKLLAAAFASITPRTAGFDTVAPANFSLASKWVMMALMFIGASPGSTGGGIKTATAAVLLVVVISMARGRQRVHLLHRTVGEGTRHRAFAIAALMAAAVFGVTFALALTERADLSTVLFEVFSALGTVGLTLGLTPMLSTAGRLIISLAMYMGRVGPLTLALAVPPARPSAVEFPQEEMMVG